LSTMKAPNLTAKTASPMPVFWKESCPDLRAERPFNYLLLSEREESTRSVRESPSPPFLLLNSSTLAIPAEVQKRSLRIDPLGRAVKGDLHDQTASCASTIMGYGGRVFWAEYWHLLPF